MLNLENLKQFTIQRPDAWTLLGDAEAFDQLPETHQAQLLFLDKAASKFMYDLLESSKLITGGLWSPFAKGNFKTVEEFSNFSDLEESKQQLKKWLFQRGIPFQNWVFVLPNYNDYPMLTTWKMIIKYGSRMFFADDITIFDASLNWCLLYYHDDKLSFGKDNIYDNTEDYKVMEAYNEMKKKYPQFKYPY